MVPEAFRELAVYPQWVAWHLEWDQSRKGGLGDWIKRPYAPGGYWASITDPKDWGTPEQAFALLARFTDGKPKGVGFVFTAADPFFFFDIDKAYKDGAWSAMSVDMLSRFPGAGVEVSQSGTGLHVIGKCVKGFDHTNRNALGMELYTAERFCAMTFTHASGSVSTSHDAAISGLVAQYFNPASRPVVGTEWTTEPVAEWKGYDDDDALIAKAIATVPKDAASVFGGAGVSFADLWAANADALGAKWPDVTSGRPFAPTEADQALANQLAFWTGKNCERMERLMRSSALFRPKWDGHATYLQNTILKAVGFVRNVYQIPTPAASAAIPPPPPEEVEAAGFKVRGGGGVMVYSLQLEHFKGCVYISTLNRVLTPIGEKLDQSRFDVVYGGYAFVIDTDGKVTTSAWEAFTRNQCYIPPIAQGVCFRPELPPGQMALSGNRALANLYIPIETPRKTGDAGPFLRLIDKLLPNERDRRILLTYLAALVQKKGHKFQWWPVIQGVQGNGKTFIIRAIAYAIGDQYTHLPNTDKMVSKGMSFNGWIEGKLFIGLEEIHVSGNPQRREFLEAFKATVTNDRLPIEGKGLEEVVGDNRANGIITTNWKDGVTISASDRRYAVFFTAQQSEADLLAAGMMDPDTVDPLDPGQGDRTSRYFQDLYDWAKGRGVHAAAGVDHGYQVINEYLSTMPLVDEFDPTGIAQRAPRTSSTPDAIVASLGRVEQEIMEAVAEGRSGFVSPWVSSMKLDSMLKDINLSVARNKRHEIMETLGYVLHPALSGGRVNNAVMPDNGKPRLYVKVGSLPLNITDPNLVASTYSQCQQALNSASAEKVFRK